MNPRYRINVNGQWYDRDELNIVVKGVPVPSGITCISYDKDGNRTEEVITHEEYERRENESNRRRSF